MNSYSEQTQFTGNGKHLKVLLKAINDCNIGLWNDFAKAQGPAFSAHLTGISLRGADLRGAHLPGARLEGADLEGANLGGANLLGAILKGANLKNVQFEGAKVKTRVRVVRKASPENTTDQEPEMDPAVLRRKRIEAAQKAAASLIEDKKKLQAKMDSEKRAKLWEGKGIRIEGDQD